MNLTPNDVRLIRQRAIFNGPVTRAEVKQLCEDWLAMRKDID